jgi:hypothetical protein
MSKIKALQGIAKFFGYGAKATKAAKAAKVIAPKASKSNKSVAALSKSIDKFKTSAPTRKADLAKKTAATASNAKKITNAVTATKKATVANRAVGTVNKAKKAGTKTAADVKKVTDAATVANATAKKAAAAKRLAEKATAVKKADFAKKVVTGRKVVVAKKTAKAKKAADTKKAAPTTESTPKVKDTSYSGTNTDTRAGKVAAYAGKKADAIGKGIAGAIKAPVKGARYVYRNPKKAAVPAAIAAVIGYGYNQNRKYNALVKLIDKKNKPGNKPKTIYDNNLMKVDTTGQAAYNKKQKLKPKNNSSLDSTALKKAQATLDRLQLLRIKK